MVKTLAQEAVGDGVLDKAEARYIEQIFDFGNRTVGDLMTPRSNVVYLSVDTPIADILEEIRRTRHTRLPVFRKHRDMIEGLLMTRDLLAADLNFLKKHPRALRKLLREPYIVPETKQASDLFTAFRKRRISVALAVDEYGGITGLITMEDLLECIFGDIPSPSDTTAETEITVSTDGTSLIDGALSIAQFNQDFATNLDAGEFDTIGGLVLHEIGEIPETGAAVLLNEFTFTVESVEANRLKTLTVRKLSPGHNDSADEEPVETDDETGKQD